MTERQWCTFVDAGTSPSGKTRLWRVNGSGGEDDFIGGIQWSTAWRQYVFVSQFAVYNPECLRQVAAFVERQTADHRAARVARGEARLRAVSNDIRRRANR